MASGPRLFGIPATGSSVIAVIRRGPSGWCQVGRWDPEAAGAGDRWRPGSWIHGTIYPQRCDVSPDGEVLAAFILKAGARWAAGATYLSLSRLPWLTALAAWGTGGTWSRGASIVPRGAAAHPVLDAPDEGTAEPFLSRWDLDVRHAITYAVERSRGWTETADSPPADRERDPWDDRRAARVIMEKRRPGEPGLRLLVSGYHAAFREGEPRRGPATYWLERDGAADLSPLPDVQWADWGRDGRLLVATIAGRLEIRPDPLASAAPAWAVDLASESPGRTPSPPEARRW